MKISTLALTFALTCLLLGASSCSHVDDFQSGGKLLQVNVQMAATSPMLTRGEATSPIISDTVDMGNDLVLVASSQPRDYEPQEYEPQEALTRGTPIKSAATLPSMNVKVYNSGTGSFSASTALTATLKGTNSSGAWGLSPAYVLKDGEKKTYIAYSPSESGSNGIVVAANGRTLTYTAPAAVANQPDLCSAAIVKDDVSSTLSLAMQHRLAAVGIKVSADNVTINEITLNNIKNSGVLNLETGVWSGVTGSASFSPALSTSTPGTEGSMNDITAANGYLMLPPQTFTADNQTITVKYTYSGQSQETATYKLKDLTGGKWDAGQLVMYEIQLNTKFIFTFTPGSIGLGLLAGTHSFRYVNVTPTDRVPTFNNQGNAWITNIRVNSSTKTVTFDYAATTVANRNATIQGVLGFGSRDLYVSQSLFFSLTTTATSISDEGFMGNISARECEVLLLLKVSSGVKWTATGSNCTPVPDNGTGTGNNSQLVLRVPANPGEPRQVSVAINITTFSVQAKTWTGLQVKKK